jgi:methylmalonyl-CoA mutase cobalamin-binding subunit
MIKTCIFADEVSKDFDEAVKLCKEAGASHIEVRGGIWAMTMSRGCRTY